MESFDKLLSFIINKKEIIVIFSFFYRLILSDFYKLLYNITILSFFCSFANDTFSNI